MRISELPQAAIHDDLPTYETPVAAWSDAGKIAWNGKRTSDRTVLHTGSCSRIAMSDYVAVMHSLGSEGSEKTDCRRHVHYQLVWGPVHT